MTAQLMLNAGKERSLFRRHPWIFAGSVERLAGTAPVRATRSRWFPARARSWRRRPGARVRRSAPASGPSSRTRSSTTPSSSAASRRRWRGASRCPNCAARSDRGRAASDPRRVGRPARCDRRPYGDTVVVQLTSAGADKWRKAIADALVKATGCARIYERSDSDVRGLEGLEPRDRLAARRGPGRRHRHRGTRRPDGGGHRRRPQDRLLPRSARQPRACCANWRRAGGAQLLLLHRRLFAAGAGRRRDARCFRSTAPARRWPRRSANLALNPQLPAQRAPNGARRMSSTHCAS